MLHFKLESARPNGNEYIEFGVGTLGGVPGGGKASDTSQQLFAYPGHGTWAYGELTFHYPNGEPSVNFKLIDTEETVLSEVNL